MTPESLRWRVIVPLKPETSAKSRLREATESSVRHAQLVRAIQRDSLDAVLTAGAAIASVHIVGQTSLFVEGLPERVHIATDPGEGLNAALTQTATQLAMRWPDDAVIAIMADLPALRPAQLAEVLQQAATMDRGVVPDIAGTGTTMLTAMPGRQLRPEFGVGSAARHRAGGAVDIDAAVGARTDVDTPEDLRRCLRLGVGHHTAEMIAHLL